MEDRGEDIHEGRGKHYKEVEAKFVDPGTGAQG